MKERTTWTDWTDGEGRTWQIVSSWRLTPEGGFRRIGIEVRSAEGHAITRRVLEDVPLEGATWYVEVLPTTIGPDGQPVPIEVVAPAPRIGRPKKYGPDHYRRVAEVYGRAVQEGRPRSQAVMEEFGLPERTAARHIAEARNQWPRLFPPKEE